MDSKVSNLVSKLRFEIKNGQLPIGSLLPTRAEMVIREKREGNCIHSNTIGKAYKQLESEGIIYKNNTSRFCVSRSCVDIEKRRNSSVYSKTDDLVGLLGSWENAKKKLPQIINGMRESRKKLFVAYAMSKQRNEALIMQSDLTRFINCHEFKCDEEVKVNLLSKSELKDLIVKGEEITIITQNDWEKAITETIGVNPMKIFLVEMSTYTREREIIKRRPQNDLVTIVSISRTFLGMASAVMSSFTNTNMRYVISTDLGLLEEAIIRPCRSCGRHLVVAGATSRPHIDSILNSLPKDMKDRIDVIYTESYIAKESIEMIRQDLESYGLGIYLEG